ncbi:MAG TPA: PLP-dependent aminotransferase family protein, partial [Clostridia bacterium]
RGDREAIPDELYRGDGLSIYTSQMEIGSSTIDFASATPSPDLFPVEDFKIVLNEILERDKGSAFGYQESQGYLPLREAICGVLKKGSITCSPASIHVISGAQQGIDIISKAFLQNGDYVIAESPTYTGAIAVFKSRGAKIADVSLTKDGPSLSVLEYHLEKLRPKFIYSIPSFQNPTGYSYSNSKREKIIELAKKYDAYIIEDDYVSELDFEDRGFLPLKAMDDSNRVIYIKSFSKIFMPGLRLGFMVVPDRFSQNLIEAKHTTDISTSGLIQRAFDLYIRRGFWDKHLSFMYGIYNKRYSAITKALDEMLPHDVGYYKPGGGLNLWLEFPYGFPVVSLFKKASANDVVFAPGGVFYSGSQPQSDNNIRISFASVSESDIGPGIEKLCRIIKEIMGGNELTTSIRIL